MRTFLPIVLIIALSTTGIHMAPPDPTTSSQGLSMNAVYDPVITVNITEGMAYTGIFDIRVTSDDLTSTGYAIFDGSVWANLDFTTGEDIFTFNTFIRSYGTYTFEFKIQNTGTSDEKSVFVNIVIKHDYDAPQITFNVQEGGTYIGIFDVVLESDENTTGTFDIDGNLYANLDLRSQTAPYTDTFPVNGFAFSYGLHTFSFNLVDDFDNTVTIEFDVILKTDITQPSITMNMTANTQYSGLFKVEVNTNEASSGYFYVDDSIWANLDLSLQTSTFDFNTFAFTDGEHDLYLKVIDLQDNVAELNISILIKNDFSAPTISTNITEGVFVGTHSFSINLNEPASVTVMLNSTLMYTESDITGMVFLLQTENFADGIYVLEISAEDHSGNLNSVQYQIEIDNIFDYKMTLDLDTTESINGTVDISLYVDVELEKVIVFINDIEQTTLTFSPISDGYTTTFSLNTTILADGNHSLRIEIYFGGEKVDDQIYEFTVDNSSNNTEPILPDDPIQSSNSTIPSSDPTDTSTPSNDDVTSLELDATSMFLVITALLIVTTIPTTLRRKL